MIVWTPAVLSVLYACVLYFCICTCSAQLSMFHMERHSRNTLIIIIIVIMMMTRYTGLSTALTKRRPLPPKRPGPQLTTFADLSRVAFPMVLYLGPHIATDPPLLVKLIRIGKAYLNKVKETAKSLAKYWHMFVLIS